MSVSMIGVMIGLPIALAIHEMMGREKFNEWFSSNDYQDYTVPKEVEEMKKTDNSNDTLMQDMFPTIYVDEQLLKSILDQYNIDILSSEKNEIICKYAMYKMTFLRETENKPFDLKIVSSNENMRLLYGCIKDINAEYLANVQERTYLKVKEQIKEEGMEIEEEQIMEDNSIVLTVTLD